MQIVSLFSKYVDFYQIWWTEQNYCQTDGRVWLELWFHKNTLNNPRCDNIQTYACAKRTMSMFAIRWGVGMHWRKVLGKVLSSIIWKIAWVTLVHRRSGCVGVNLRYDSHASLTSLMRHQMTTKIARFVGQTWGPSGSCRPQMGPMLAPWTLLSGKYCR